MNHRQINCLSAIVLLFACNAVYAADGEFKSEEDKTFYYMGSNIGLNLSRMKLSDEEIDWVLQGLRDAAKGQAIKLDDQIYTQKIQALAEQRMASGAEEEKAAAQAYLDKMAAKDGAITTESGIVFRELVAGTGETPAADSVVKAHYHGTLRDGTVFDSSVDRGEPFTASLSKVIPCWKEAMTLMKEGGKSEVTCPAKVAYGDRGAGTIPGGAALTFEVELIAVVE
jgi:FKBP-type peptidyl-prolyl cis-trans isomerase FkpA